MFFRLQTTVLEMTGEELRMCSYRSRTNNIKRYLPCLNPNFPLHIRGREDLEMEPIGR